MGEKSVFWDKNTRFLRFFCFVGLAYFSEQVSHILNNPHNFGTLILQERVEVSRSVDFW